MSTPTTVPSNRSESNSETIATFPVFRFDNESGAMKLVRDPNTSLQDCFKIAKLQHIMLGALNNRSDNARVAKAVIRHGYNVNTRVAWNNGLTIPFVCFVANCDALNVLKVFVNCGVCLKSHDEQGYSLLHIAVSHCNYEMTKWLIEQGVDVHAISRDRITALDLAFRTTFKSCLEQARMITLLQNAMELKVQGVVVENVAGKECLICFDCGDPSDACKLTCCHQMVHISCLKQWHKLSVNKDCPHCRAPLKTVVKIITKPTLSPFNLRKNLTKGLIYKYIK